MNSSTYFPAAVRSVTDELTILSEQVELDDIDIIELGCGAARLAQGLLAAHPRSRYTGLEVDQQQHAKNVSAPMGPMRFLLAGAQAIPLPDASFDLALMLKSLHHVPLPLMDQALAEVARVVRPGGLLYVSEPVFHGGLNEVIRLYNDEGVVREAALAAVHRAGQGPLWQAEGELFFEMPVRFRDFAEFEQRMINVTFAERHLSEALREAVRARFEPHMGADGAHFTRPMRVNLLRRLT